MRSDFLLSRPRDARRFVAETKDDGYDFIKVYNGLSEPVYRALMEEARARGIAVVGHGVRSVGIQGLLEAGQVMVAHSEEYIYAYFESDLGPDMIPAAVEMTRAAGAYVVPNLSAYEIIALQWGKPRVLEGLLRSPELRFTHPFWRSYWASGRYTSRRGDLSLNLEFLRELTRAFSEAKVPLLLGTDSPSIPGMLPGFSIHADLKNLVQSGLSPYEALKAGTQSAGEFLTTYVLGTEPFGTITVGGRADMILLEANPLSDIDNLKRRVGVMVHGRWLSEARLQEMLQELADSIDTA